MSTSRLARRMLAECLVVLVVFALYAPSIRLMLIHDDAINLNWMNAYNVLTIFTADWAAGGASARPMANILWILTRDAFGWYVPALIHMWNVWLHMLNVALVASLAARLGSRFGLCGLLFPTLSALIFGLFPLSFQSVIWAGAIYHPVMATFGLLAVHASLMARDTHRMSLWLICLACVLAASLSHEAGFIFGLLVLALHVLLSAIKRERLPAGAVAVASISLIYPLLNRLAFATSRSTSNLSAFSGSFGDRISNAVYFMQAMASWVVILARPAVGLTESSAAIIAVLFFVGIGLALLLLFRAHLAWLGLFGLGWWVLTALPSVIFLNKAYVSFGPRLLYVPSIGIALFWAAVVAVLVERLRQPVLQIPALALIALLLGWGVPYIRERMDEAYRLTPAMTAIDAELRKSNPAAKVLFVNMPWWNAPAYPAFLVGAEGMPIFQHDGAPAWTWLATVNGARRETEVVRHEPSLTHDERWLYGQPGETLDSDALRERILQSDYAYQFHYDSPGLRVQRLAAIRPIDTDDPPNDYVAALANGDGRVLIHSASARVCDGRVYLDLAWSSNGGIRQPTGVFVHGIDAQGQQTIAADRDLMNGLLPLEQLPVGIGLDEEREITPPNSTPLKELRVGAYRRDDLNRFAATHPDGSIWSNDEIVVPIEPNCNTTD